MTNDLRSTAYLLLESDDSIQEPVDVLERLLLRFVGELFQSLGLLLESCQQLLDLLDVLLQLALIVREQILGVLVLVREEVADIGGDACKNSIVSSPHSVFIGRRHWLIDWRLNWMEGGSETERFLMN